MIGERSTIKVITLNAFSLSGYLLPTFQKATLETKYIYWVIKVKRFLTFSYFETEGDIMNSNYKTTRIEVR